MPALTGSDKAIAWGRKIRHGLLTAALPPSARLNGTTDEAVLALVGHARTVVAAAWWIDHRKIEPGDLAVLLDRVVARRRNGASTRR